MSVPVVADAVVVAMVGVVLTPRNRGLMSVIDGDVDHGHSLSHALSLPRACPLSQAGSQPLLSETSFQAPPI